MTCPQGQYLTVVECTAAGPSRRPIAINSAWTCSTVAGTSVGSGLRSEPHTSTDIAVLPGGALCGEKFSWMLTRVLILSSSYTYSHGSLRTEGCRVATRISSSLVA